MSEKVEIMNPDAPEPWDKKQDDDRRRLKVLMIGEEMLLRTVLRSGHDYLVLDDPSVPTDIEVVSVNHYWDFGGFGFLCRHDSFPVHEDGAPFEKVWPLWKITSVTPLVYNMPTDDETIKQLRELLDKSSSQPTILFPRMK